MITVLRVDGTENVLMVCVDYLTGKYCLVNLTNKMIGKARFDTEEEIALSMQHYKKIGKIKEYIIV